MLHSGGPFSHLGVETIQKGYGGDNDAVNMRVGKRKYQNRECVVHESSMSRAWVEQGSESADPGSAQVRRGDSVFVT